MSGVNAIFDFFWGGDDRDSDAAELLLEAFEAANIGAWTIYEQQRVVSWGKLGQSDSGGEVTQELPLDNLLSQVHPEDLPGLQQRIAEAFATGDVFVTEYRMLINDEIIWLFSKGRVYDDSKGRRLSGIVFDITKRKAQELASEQTRKQLRGLIDTLDTYVGLLTLDGRLIEANNAALAIANLSKQDVIGIPFWESYWLGYSEANKQRVKDAIAKVAKGEIVQFDMDVRVAGGDFITIDFRMAPLYNDAGEVEYLVPSAIDITPRLAAEKQTRYLATILKEVSEGIASTDVDRVIMSWNRGAELMYGYSAEEAIGQHVAELLKPTYMSATFEEAFDALHSTGYWQGEVQQIHKDGHTMDVLVSLKLLHDKDGNVSGIIAANRDITDWKTLERERSRLLTTLEDERARLEVLLQSLPVGVVVGLPSGEITVFNRRAEEILGHGMIPTETTNDFRQYGAVHGDGRPYEPVDHPLAKVLGEQVVIDNHEMRYRRPDGSEVLIDVNAAPVFDEAGRLLAGVVTLDDITEQKQMTQLLQHQVKRQEVIANLGQEALAADDLDEFLDELCIALKVTLNVDYVRILELSEDATELLQRDGVGWDDDAIQNCVTLSDESGYEARVLRDNLGLLAIEDFADSPYLLPDTLKGAGVQSGLVLKIVGVDKPFGILELYSRTKRRFTIDDRQFVQSIGHILSEVISRKQGEAALVELNASLESRVEARTEELQAVNKELEAFAYSVSHDLRAPLRGIDGFSKALLEDYGDEFDETARHYVERVRAGAQRMGQLIDELLAFSRLSRSALRKSTVDLSKVAQGIVRELQELEPQRQVAVTIEPELLVTGDANLLTFALQNLFNNAWKFTRHTEAAQIFFGYHKSDDEVVFVIRDNGAGFDMLYADKLFGAFQRLHSAETFEGTGIGLANVQRIIHRHGGRIWAEGEVDNGAAFYFTLEGDVDETTGNDSAG
jgi:PAS domain S-box-containing protein